MQSKYCCHPVSTITAHTIPITNKPCVTNQLKTCDNKAKPTMQTKQSNTHLVEVHPSRQGQHGELLGLEGHFSITLLHPDPGLESAEHILHLGITEK